MIARVTIAGAALLSCLGLMPAQTYLGAAPPLARPLAPLPGLQPADFGVFLVETMSAWREPAGTYYLAITSQQSPTSPHRISAWRFDPTGRSLVRLSDFDAVTLNGDQQVALSPDLLSATIFRIGVGMEVLTRAAATAPWGPRRRITGLPNVYSPAIALIDSGLDSTPTTSLVTCSVTDVWIHDYNAGTGVATNGRSRRFALGGPNNNLGCVIPLAEPETGTARGLIVIEEAFLLFQQRAFWTPSVDEDAPFYAMFDTARGNVIVGGCQWEGGTTAACMLEVFPAQFDNSVLDLSSVYTFNTEVPAGGGRTKLWVLTPATQPAFIGTLGIGFLASSGLSLAALGIRGELALDPSWMLFLPWATKVAGHTSYSLYAPAGASRLQFAMQPLAWDPELAGFILGGSGFIDW